MRYLCLLLMLTLVFQSPVVLHAQENVLTIYDDALAVGWQNWSWSSTVNFEAAGTVHNGQNALATTFDQGWAGLYLRSESALPDGFDTLRFWVWGTGQTISIQFYDEDSNATDGGSITPPANTWTQVDLPIGSSANLWGVVWMETTGSAQPQFLLDDIQLLDSESAPQPDTSSTPTPPSPDEPTNVFTIYDDALAAGWQNWSWSSTINFEAAGTVHNGQNALATTFDQGWAGLYLRSESALPDGFDTLRFWVWGTGQTISIQFYDEDSNATDAGSITPPANTWTQIDLPLTSANLWGLVWMETTGSAQPQFLLDDIQLLGSGEIPSTGTLALNIDAAADQHPISPYIYGLNFADPDLAADIRLPVNRWGGNAVTRYNWQNDTSNRASDWYFENIPNDNANPAALPNDSSSDQFVAGNITTDTDSLITVPLIGWTPSSREFACGFSVTQYGEQQDTDTWQPDCGNGVQPDGSMVTGNDPADTSTAIGPEFVQDWIRHLIERFGNAENGGVRFYNLDNEPALWNSTHRDVHPDPLSYDELRDRTYAYAAAIKAVDPAALTLGPVEWGWVNYFYSALDVASDPAWWNNAVDRNAHGGEPLVQWYLEQMQLYEQQNGVRILDYLDLHYYPQGDSVSLSSAGSAETQALRLRSTRSLWDPTYVDESWIGESVMLLPRMHDWVDQYYPGTKLAVTEYNFGALDDINGALAQADVLGIFGREGLDLATLWDPPSSSEPGAFAFRMYRNYDGTGSAFGETSVQATSTDQAQLAVYAALRSDGALTLMVINKTNAALNTTLSIQNFEAGTAEIYRYSADNLNQIVQDADVTFTEGSLDTLFPPNSVTLLVLK